MISLLDLDLNSSSVPRDPFICIQKSIPYSWPRWRQNGQNRHPIYDQNGWKTLPFGAAHTYIAHIREYPPGISMLLMLFEKPWSEDWWRPLLSIIRWKGARELKLSFLSLYQILVEKTYRLNMPASRCVVQRCSNISSNVDKLKGSPCIPVRLTSWSPLWSTFDQILRQGRSPSIVALVEVYIPGSPAS